MEGDLLKTFDTLPILESKKINDVTDQVPMTHAAGTVEQGDVGITPNILQSCTILRCNSDAKSASKVCEYVGGMPLTGSIEQCAGRTVLVIFTNGNDVKNPQINYENASGPIILINQASNVTVGKGCWTAGSRQLFTIDGSAWVMHSNVAQQTSEYTILADGTFVYNKGQVDKVLSDKIEVYAGDTIITPNKYNVGSGIEIDFSSNAPSAILNNLISAIAVRCDTREHNTSVPVLRNMDVNTKKMNFLVVGSGTAQAFSFNILYVYKK